MLDDGATGGESASRGTIAAGGAALIGGALGFLGVFGYLAAKFNYPEVLDGHARDVLPALLATGDGGRIAWAFYAFLPLIFVPAGVGAFEALRARAQGPMRLGLVFAVTASFAMMLGLMRWPSIHWEIARAWPGASESERATLTVVFDGLNRYLGNFIGEFLGEMAFSLFFIFAGVGLLRHRQRALAWCGIATGVLGLVGMWRNVTGAVSAVASVNNYLLPSWMLAFGVWLVLAARTPARRHP